VRVRAQKPLFCGSIAVSDFSQHPTDRLVHEIVLVVEQQLRNLEGV